MADCRIYVPLNFFPSRAQLEPMCPNGYLEVSDFDETAQIKWKGLSLSLARMPKSSVEAELHRLIAHAKENGGNAALETRILHTLSVYTCTVTPDFDQEGLAMRVVSGITDAAGGLCLLDGELFAPGGQALLGDSPLVAPLAERVRDRAWVLLALSMRGLLEQDKGTKDEKEAEALRSRLHDWAESSIIEELEDEEREFLATPIGKAPPQLVIDAVWRAEGAQVLLWALGARALPAIDAQEHPYAVARESGVMSEVPSSLKKPKLRNAGELEAKRKSLLGVHWRIRERDLRPGPIDFVKFAKTSDFSIEGLTLNGADLALDPANISLVRSIAHERHLAANWVIGTHPSYAQVNTPT